MRRLLFWLHEIIGHRHERACRLCAEARYHERCITDWACSCGDRTW